MPSHRNQDSIRRAEEAYRTASKTYYPTVPSPPLAPSLPLLNYTGTYYHPAYHHMTLSLKDDHHLYINRSDAYWKIAIDLEHVSGDNFIAYMGSTVSPGVFFQRAVPAEFKIGSNGVSKAFGIFAEPEMGAQSRIWFERV
jgi:hypothetical protein